MNWNKTFSGTRHEIIADVNAAEFPPEAHPVQAVRQIIGGQLPESLHIGKIKGAMSASPSIVTDHPTTVYTIGSRKIVVRELGCANLTSLLPKKLPWDDITRATNNYIQERWHEVNT